MKVFLTGANGFIGSALIPELIGAGHQVLGLTRSEDGARSLRKLGAQAHRGSLEEAATLRAGVSQADGVIHCAYDLDLSNMAETAKKETRAIEALAADLAGSDRPLVITSVAAMGSPAPGQTATEDFFDANSFVPRVSTEVAGEAALRQGVKVSTVRVPQVHSPVKMGFFSRLLHYAREKGVSAYLGDGSTRWAAVHLLDTVRLYRLALERNEAGARYHAVAEEGVPVREVAEMIGAGLQLPTRSLTPEEAKEHFGWFGSFVGLDMPASSTLTRQRLGWTPTGPSLAGDVELALTL